MRRSLCCTFALAAVCAASTLVAQQGPPMGPPAGGPPPEKARAIENGGIFIKGWVATVDAGAVKQGQSAKDAKLSTDGASMHVETGPALTYWKEGAPLTGDYTVSATFLEPKYMNRNSHPHPYGIAIAGNGIGTPDETALYCAAYGNGNFIVRGFGPDAFQMNGGHGEKNDAVHKAAAPGEPVEQKIALQVKGDKVSCMINDVTVASYAKSDLVAAGKLMSTDGMYGLRFAHNTDAKVSDLKVTKP